MNLFLDTEFTGLHRHATLISLAFVAETGEELYCELTDWDQSQLNPWLKENVISHLAGNLNSNFGSIDFAKDHSINFSGTRNQLTEALKTWLHRFGTKEKPIHIWGDCLAYDWVLFCDLFDGALNIPDCISYQPFDLPTFYIIKGIDPNITNEQFAGTPLPAPGNTTQKHNALYDARMIKLCYDKLRGMG
jgi:hypothetical protein